MVAGLGLVAEKVAGLTVEGVAECGEGGEADCSGSAVLEDRQVDHGDSDAVGQFGEGQAALLEQPVQVHGDAVVSVLGGHSDRALDVLAQPRAVGEQFGQDEHAEPGEQAGDGDRRPVGTCQRVAGRRGLHKQLLQDVGEQG